MKDNTTMLVMQASTENHIGENLPNKACTGRLVGSAFQA
jgi:hypothetical protein